ncbi:hypothetical protein MKW92_028194 [Papaver armeniacum]|nr:hypothetical protein MKW92_028194 [Papaver armeniacum]
MSFEVCIRRPRSLLVMAVEIAQFMGNDVDTNINSSRQEANRTKVAIVTRLLNDVCLILEGLEGSRGPSKTVPSGRFSMTRLSNWFFVHYLLSL